jgi:hypothetical protein
MMFPSTVCTIANVNVLSQQQRDGKSINRAMIGCAYANGGLFFAVPSMVARPTLMTPFSLR